MRRAAFVLAAVACGAGAVVTTASARPAAARAPQQLASASAHTPLWSARRIPTILRASAERAALDRVRVGLTAALDPIVQPVDACVAVDSGTRPLARLGNDRALAPASTLKLVTATAAVDRLGPEHRFTTRALTDPAGGLVLVGAGDPLLATPEYAANMHALARFRDAPYTPLSALADSIVAAGVRDVRGGLVVDDHLHDTLRFLPDWKPVYAAEGDIGALGALTVDGGFGDPAALHPSPDPAVTTGQRLAAMLEARGVAIAGGVRRGLAPPDAREIAHVDSPPLEDIVHEMLTSSDNYTAEELLRDLSAEAGNRPAGTTQGIAIAMKTLEALHVPHDGLAMHDGSGLAPGDRVKCTTMLSLVELATTPRFRAIARGLAVAARTGTLAERFVGGPLAGRLHAKTGSIRGVVGLVGLVDGPDDLRFAFLANGNFSAGGGAQLQAQVAAAVGSTPDLRRPPGLLPAP